MPKVGVDSTEIVDCTTVVGGQTERSITITEERRIYEISWGLWAKLQLRRWGGMLVVVAITGALLIGAFFPLIQQFVASLGAR